MDFFTSLFKSKSEVNNDVKTNANVKCKHSNHSQLKILDIRYKQVKNE